MTEYQSNDVLTGRIIAARQMVAQCENEIKQLEGILQHRKLTHFFVEPEIPEGWTKYDPNVPPPENADEIHLMWDDKSESIWCGYRLLYILTRWQEEKDLLAYRVTKWKEEKQILEDARNNLSREVYEVVLHGAGSNLANLDNALQQFAESIIQRAVEEAKEVTTDTLCLAKKIIARCRKEGARASWDGFTSDACPYDEELEKAAWLDGWSRQENVE